METAEEYYNQLGGDKRYFTKLTSTGITDNLENVFEFAERYAKRYAKAKLEEAADEIANKIKARKVRAENHSDDYSMRNDFMMEIKGLKEAKQSITNTPLD